MECKVGYIRGHGFSALEELGLMLCGQTAGQLSAESR